MADLNACLRDLIGLNNWRSPAHVKREKSDISLEDPVILIKTFCQKKVKICICTKESSTVSSIRLVIFQILKVKQLFWYCLANWNSGMSVLCSETPTFHDPINKAQSQTVFHISVS